ncbi:hypothetical protein E2562_007930 [Oryza meyeriana var. granulata]|uniref:Uncharacterized protein n=1 Tax=Oryza meyeriana var. granulata TaxID=110450 RepID=A0A6G1DFC9_9ORYZ|nr:hypothetical protein E2562_007930 [Oryza meyeriana var. granulata]
MRRHGGSEASPSIIHTSSIALLQERFRNLQRVKEMREAGRELNRVHPADAAHDRATAGAAASPLGLGLHAAANGNEQPRWFLHPDLVRPSRPLRIPSSSYHGLSGGGVQQASPSTPPVTSPWGDLPRTTTTTMQNSGYRGDVDVDTSLHL